MDILISAESEYVLGELHAELRVILARRGEVVAYDGQILFEM